MRSHRIPLPLLAILAVVLVEGLAWAIAIPPLQGADEAAHLSYVQEIADAGHVPWTTNPGLPVREFPGSVSSEQRIAWVYAGLEGLRGNLAARPLWTHADEEIWQTAMTTLPAGKKDAVGSAAWRNPPLYYLAAVVPYEIAGGSLFDRIYALRLYNVALLLLTVALVWLLAGEVFGRRRELQTVAAGAVALHPLLLDVTTRVTPDGLLVALSAGVLYLMTLVVRRGPSWRLVTLLAFAVACAALTQGRALGFVVPALFAVGLAFWRRRRPAAAAEPWRFGRSPTGWAVVALAVVAALVGLAFYATRYRAGELAGFWSYLWQFYLPALPGMSPPVGIQWGVEDVFLERFLGTFVQFEVGFSGGLLSVLRVAVWVGLALVVAAAWRHRQALWDRRDVVAVLVITLVLSLLALHGAAFRSLLVNPADPIITGRYLLMLIPLFGIGVAAAMSALPGRIRAGTTGAVLAGAVLLQLSAFGIVVARFYA